MSLNVRSGLGQVPTFVFVPAVVGLALAAISPSVSTAKNTSVAVGNVPGLSVGVINPTANKNLVVRVLNVPGKSLAALVAVSNFKVRVNATVKNLPLGGTGFVHGVSAVNASLPVGTLARDGVATPEHIALVLPVTGSLPVTATATIRYRQSPAGAWNTGHPLMRTRPDLADTGGPVIEDVFAWMIIDLSPGTAYDVEATVTNGVTQQVLAVQTFTTSVLPAVAGAMTVSVPAGSSAATIQSAINGAAAGAVVEIQGNCTVASTISVNNNNGITASPITVRGLTRATTLTRASGKLFSLQACKNIIFERMTLQGSGVDSGTAASSIAFEFFNGVPAQSGITFRGLIVNGFDRGIGGDSAVDGVLVYDNTLTGNNTWTQDFYGPSGSGTPNQADGIPDQKQNVFWNDDGVALSGTGISVFNNTISGFGDTFSVSYSTSTPGLTKGIFFHRNDVPRTGDDLLEADYGYRNIAFYDNRARNVSTMLSTDPLYSGPLLFARNIVINPIRNRWLKLNGKSVGIFLYNNTFVVNQDSDALTPNVAGMYLPASGGPLQSVIGFKNNLTIYRGAAPKLLWMDQTGWTPIEWDHNGWYPDRAINWLGNFANLAAAQSGMAFKQAIFSNTTVKPMTNDIVVSSATPFNETITFGADALTEYTTAVTPTLQSGSNAKAKGAVIANITDGFTGAQPDLGATFSRSGAMPVYGDRTVSSTQPAFIAALADAQVLTTATVANSQATMRGVMPTGFTPSDGGNGPDSVIKAYSGGCKGESSTLYVWGGGHNDSPNNGLYANGIGPTMPTGWTVDITPFAQTPAFGQTPRFNSDSASKPPNGRPNARHTYDGCVITSAGKVLSFCGAFWSGGNQNTWSFEYDPANPGAGYIQLPDAPFSIDDGFGAWTLYDKISGNVLVGRLASNTCAFFRTATRTWSAAKSMGATIGTDVSGAFDHTRSRGIFIDGVSSKLATVNFTTETVSTSTITLTGSTAIATTGRAVSTVYDSACDSYFMIGGASGSPGYTNRYELPAAGPTWPITAKAMTGNAPIVSVSGQVSSFGRIAIEPTFRTLAFVASIDQPMSIIKLPRVYETSFPLTENPISEGGNWKNGLADGLNWSNCSTIPGKMIGLQLSGHATDATAVLTGTWAANQSAEATVFCSNQSDPCFEEVELRLRTTIAANSIAGYEISFHCQQSASQAYIIIVRWNGPAGSYDYLGASGSATWNGAAYAVNNGARVRAEIIGNVINAYINDVLKATVNITSIPGTVFNTGNPGMGANLENGGSCTGRNADYGFTHFKAREL